MEIVSSRLRGIVIVFLILILDSQLSFAGGGEIFISSSGSCSSNPNFLGPASQDCEFPQFLLSPNELIIEYQHYFLNEPTRYSGILNQGALRFCGSTERVAIFEFLIRQLDKTTPVVKVWEALVQQYRSDTLLLVLDEDLKQSSLNEQFRSNLVKLKNLIESHRKLAKIPGQIEIKLDRLNR